jgi:hypothetical protein
MYLIYIVMKKSRERSAYIVRGHTLPHRDINGESIYMYSGYRYIPHPAKSLAKWRETI